MEKKSINLILIVVIKGLQTAFHRAIHCLIGLEIADLSSIVQRGVAQPVLLVDDPLDLTPDRSGRVGQDRVEGPLVLVSSIVQEGQFVGHRLLEDGVKDGAVVDRVQDGEPGCRNRRVWKKIILKGLSIFIGQPNRYRRSSAAKLLLAQAFAANFICKIPFISARWAQSLLSMN